MTDRKVCSACEIEKDIEDFGMNGVYRRSQCFECRRERKNLYVARNRELVNRNHRRAHYRSRYGLEYEEVEALHEAADNTCEICLIRPSAAIDHDHATGEVRGVLCRPCNTALAAFFETPETFYRAVDYLKRGIDG